MSSKADRLGRGASFGATAGGVSARRAAIAAATGAPTTGVVPHELAIEVISHNPDNPRETITGIEMMADTFDSVGQTTAITVATVQAYLADRADRAGELEAGAQYVVVDGHRRLAAARLLGWESIRVMVDDAQVSSDERLLEAAFIANTQRDDMSELDQAAALNALVEFYGSQGKAAKRLGLTQGFISQRLSLLRLSPELQADLNSGARQVKHVRNLASLPPEVQKAKADERAATAKGRPMTKPGPAQSELGTHYPVMGSGQTASPDEAPRAVPPPDHTPSAPPPANVPAQSSAPAAPPAARPETAPAGEWAGVDLAEAESVAAYLIERLPVPARRKVVMLLLESYAPDVEAPAASA